VSEPETRAALEALPGRDGLIASTQDGDEFHVTGVALAGDVLTVLAPRMKVGGIDTLTLRFSVSDSTWTAAFEFLEAEFHSHELATVRLALRAIEPLGAGTRATRVPAKAEGKLRIIEARNVMARNEFPVSVEDVSASGLRFTCDFDVETGDVFTISVDLEGRTSLHSRCVAVAVEPAAFGRKLVRAKIDRRS
jgi:hypothetical protein